MPLYMDHHRKVEGLTADAVGQAHQADMKIQAEFGVNYINYWFDEASGQVWCLVDAPNIEAAHDVHRKAHGLVADDITPVQQGV